jgi:uncharacterized protein YqjF (DUF2071 family)
MRQEWRQLLFLHFAVPADRVQPLLPPGLTVDTFPDAHGEEMAWIGLVPFRMQRVRPLFAPSLRGLSDFPETNVRTYVHREGQDPGVWFFSLDAHQALACAIARATFSLPYHFAQMTVDSRGPCLRYGSVRVADGRRCRIEATLGSNLGAAAPGSLEFFLVERYRLYAARGSRLITGRVHHAPYSLQRAELHAAENDLVEAAGLPQLPFTHCVAASGVDVEVFRPHFV